MAGDACVCRMEPDFLLLSSDRSQMVLCPQPVSWGRTFRTRWISSAFVNAPSTIARAKSSFLPQDGTVLLKVLSRQPECSTSSMHGASPWLLAIVDAMSPDNTMEWISWGDSKRVLRFQAADAPVVIEEAAALAHTQLLCSTLGLHIQRNRIHLHSASGLREPRGRVRIDFFDGRLSRQR